MTPKRQTLNKILAELRGRFSHIGAVHAQSGMDRPAFTSKADHLKETPPREDQETRGHNESHAENKNDYAHPQEQQRFRAPAKHAVNHRSPKEVATKWYVHNHIETDIPPVIQASRGIYPFALHTLQHVSQVQQPGFPQLRHGLNQQDHSASTAVPSTRRSRPPAQHLCLRRR